MTATTARLDAIEARSQGLTDLCAEHLRQSIRHVQRNCDIDCNIHEDETTWDDCKRPEWGDGDRMAAVLADFPYLLTLARKQAAALEAVRKLATDWDVVHEAFPRAAGGVLAKAHANQLRTALEADND